MDENTAVINREYIRVRKVFHSKSPSLSKVIPGFIYRYLERIIHEDTINDALYRNRNKWGLEFVEAILEEFNADIRSKGLENIEKNGRYVVASNHPLGGLDGLALMKVIGEVRKDIIFPVNDLLLNLPNLKELFIPINKHGSNIDNIRMIEETFASDKMILYFPAGLVSRKQKGIIRDLEWKKTFLSRAKKYNREIIPVHIDGRNSNFFYRLANLRKKTGIKANIEMLYLVDEMYRQRNQIINITFGRPIPHTFFDRSRNDREWASLLREYIYHLPDTSQTFQEFVS